MWKDKGLQLVMLPTTNSSNLGLYIDTKNLVLRKQSDIPRGESQYLYLLSDEEIKEGEIVLTDENSIERATGLYGNFPCDLINEVGGQRKVIAATDPSLNLPQFPSSFLEEYVKRYNSKKSLEVEVKYESYWEDYHGRETNEESDFCYNLNRLKVNPDNTISILFKEEKKYSQAQMEMRLLEGIGHAISYPETFVTGICLDSTKTKNWIKKNLK